MTQLHDACERGDMEEVTFLLNNEECDINTCNAHGDQPLHIACKNADLEIVTVLLKDQKCYLDTRNKDGNTPLHLACHNKILPIVRLLLERKCSTYICNKKGEIAQHIPLSEDGDGLLHIACQWGDVDIVRYLIIDEKCDINLQNADQNTPLHFACYQKLLDIIKLLLEMRCITTIPNKKHQTAQDIPLNKDGDCLLHIACLWGDVEIVKYLITDESCNPNVQTSTSENTPLHIATKYGEDDTIIQMFLYKQCNPNVQNREGDTPLHIAVRENTTLAISQLLTSKQCNPNVQNKDDDTPLHIAVRHNKIVAISQLLAHPQRNVNVKNKQGDTPLHIAVSCGQNNIIIPQLMSCRECDLNVLNKEGDTPLHIAVIQNKTAAISKLLAHQQCNPNVQNKEGDTPLHIACCRKSLDIIKLLLEMKCSTNILNKKGETVQDIPLNEDRDCLLHIACQWGNMDIVRYLITDESCNFCDQSYISKNTPLHIAVMYGQDDITGQLLLCDECGLNVQNVKGDTPLHAAVKQNRTVSVFKLLAMKQCELNIQNTDSETPLHIAVRQVQDETIIRLLSLEKCNPNLQNREGNTPLHIACYRKSFHIIRHLLERGCSTQLPNKKGETAQNIPLNEDGDCLLHIACQWGDVNIVKYLITDESCNPNVQTSTSENTPLHIATKYGEDDTIIQMFLYKQCNPNVQNREGDTPLHIAVRENTTLAISQLLTSKQCNPNVQNKDDDTPLHIAVRHNKIVAISQLLAHPQRNVNVKNKQGDTPLHMAVSCGQNNIIIPQLLSCRECDLNVLNKEGDTPLHIAVIQNKVAAISKLLAHRQCNPNVQNKEDDTPLHIACCRKSLDIDTQNTDSETPLHIAVRQVQDETIIRLLSLEKCNPNLQNREGNTPLHIACYRKSFHIIRHLLERSCSAQFPNNKGETAQDIPLNEDGDCLLHIACQWGDVDTVRHLVINEPCNLQIQNADLNTPLHIACNSQSLSIIRLLLEGRCNTNIPNTKGETAQDIPLNKDGDCLLHIACQWGDVGIVKHLVVNEPCYLQIQNANLNTPLHIACYQKSLSIIRFLLERRCSTNIPNKKGETAQDIPLNKDGDCLLHNACQWGDVDTVRHLVINERCNPNIQSYTSENTPLHIAVKSGQDGIIVQLLLCKECDFNVQNKDGDTPLHIAVRYGQGDIIVQLLSCEECDLNVQNRECDTPLHIAVRQNKTGAISHLLAHQQCNVNVQNQVCDTPLHIAVRYGQDDIFVQLLLHKKCDPNAQNRNGDTPLHIAIRQNKRAAISRLLAHQQCNINIQNKVCDTPLHIATKYGQEDAIDQLFSYKECDPNAQNKDGDTALHFAVIQSKKASISQLLTHPKCNTLVQNREGDTPLHIACYNKSLDIIRILLKKRCSTHIPNGNGQTAQDIPLNEDGDCLLHIACQWGDMHVVKYLITDERCDPNIQNANMDTPLHIACYLLSVSIIRLLLEMRCSTNIPNTKGETAQDIPLNEDGDCLLHLACQWGDVGIVKYLITDERCDHTIQNMHLNTPLHIACYSKAVAIIRFLLQMRCSSNTPNVKGETAQNILLNDDGDCLLHIACQWGDVDIVNYLINDQKCCHNVQNAKFNTPLHVACLWKSLSITRVLLEMKCSTNIPNKKGETAQYIPLNDNGDLLLHIACQWGDVDIVRYLIIDEKCDINLQNADQNTPLHFACYQKLLDIIKLLLEMKCITTIPNQKGETAQDIPLNEDGDCLLHIACQWGDVGIVRYLITDEECNPNVQSFTSKSTPLHIAAECGEDDAILQLLSCEECDINFQNKEGNSPLHIAVRQNNSVAISGLLAHQQCHINVQNEVGDTPLHIAVKEGMEAPVYRLHTAVQQTIVQLLSCEGCDLNIRNKEGDAPLHIAVRDNVTIDTVRSYEPLICDARCDVNILNNDHLTPLLTAIKHNNPAVATALLQHKKCDPTLCDLHGNTTLHLAFIGGETQPEMVEVANQLLRLSVDPMCVNYAGQTPIELTTNYQLIQAISHLIKCKEKQSVQTYINLFVVGNPETGKSTLVKAICKEASILWKIVPKNLRRVKNVPLHTAGIVPTTFRSKTFGNTVLYDLAGQVEYYTSHAAVIQSTVISTPPAFIVVINLSESEEKISQTLRYWWSFIDNHAARSRAPPQVIVVGSHSDVVKSTGGSVQEKMTIMIDSLKQFPASFHFAGQVALDCRDPASRKLQVFCTLVNQSCTVLRQTADVDLRCHVLYAFLLERFQGKVACTVSDVATSVKATSALLPQNSDSLIPLISTLSDKGLLLLVQGGKSHGNWWIILQKQALLCEINGTMFAPKNFIQHKNLSWSTGVVSFSKLKNRFPDYNPIMVSEFLTHLEFCFKVEDHETVKLLKEEATNVEDTTPDASDEYYFFPALVSVKNPMHIWEQNDDMSIKCGWLYQCSRPDQFLSTQFLHVLILRLAFKFALQLDPVDYHEDSLTLCRKCSVWKHGIAWLNRVPIETVVEVGLQHQSVIVMMRCPKGMETKCVQLRSEVIQKVLEAKDEHCKPVEMSESFIHPNDVRYPFTDNIEDVKLYTLTEIARMAVKREVNVLDRRGWNPIAVQDLLLFDPYTSTKLMSELFTTKHSVDEKVRSQVLEILKSESEEFIYA